MSKEEETKTNQKKKKKRLGQIWKRTESNL